MAEAEEENMHVLFLENYYDMYPLTAKLNV
jgi:hypothetical protein